MAIWAVTYRNDTQFQPCTHQTQYKQRYPRAWQSTKEHMGPIRQSRVNGDTDGPSTTEDHPTIFRDRSHAQSDRRGDVHWVTRRLATHHSHVEEQVGMDVRIHGRLLYRTPTPDSGELWGRHWCNISIWTDGGRIPIVPPTRPPTPQMARLGRGKVHESGGYTQRRWKRLRWWCGDRLDRRWDEICCDDRTDDLWWRWYPDRGRWAARGTRREEQDRGMRMGSLVVLT